MRIIVDFDGTIANTAYYAFKKTLKERAEIFKPEVVCVPMTEEEYCDKIDWDFNSFLEDPKGLQWILKNMNEWSMFHFMPPMKGLKETLEKLRADGHQLILCSRRIEYEDGSGFMNMLQWLKRNDLYDLFDNYAFVKTYDKSIIQGDIIIDDKVECLAGIRRLKILFGDYHYQIKDLEDSYEEYKWNTRLPEGMCMAKDWEEVYTIVSSLGK